MIVVLWTAAALLVVYGLLYVSKDYLSPLALYSYFGTLTFLVRGGILAMGWDDFYAPHLLRRDLGPLVEHALTIFLVAHAAVLLGYGALGGTARRLAGVLPRMGGRMSEVRLTLLCSAMFVATFCAFLVAVLSAGGVGASVVESRSGEGSNLLKQVPQFAVLFVGLAVVATHAARARRALRFTSLLFLGMLGLNIPFGDRSAVLLPFVIGAVARHLSGRTLHKMTLALVTGTLVLSAAAMGEIRGALLHAHGDVATAEIAELYSQDTPRVARTVTNGFGLQPFDYFIVVLQDFDYDNFRYGEDFIAGLAGVIPRAIWPSKPDAITPGQWFRARYVPNGSGGRPYTTQGVYWINFGIPGVFLGYLFFGLVLRILTEFIIKDRSIFGGGFVALSTLMFNAGIPPIAPLLLVKWILPFALCVALLGVRSRMQRAPVRDVVSRPTLGRSAG